MNYGPGLRFSNEEVQNNRPINLETKSMVHFTKDIKGKHPEGKVNQMSWILMTKKKKKINNSEKLKFQTITMR